MESKENKKKQPITCLGCYYLVKYKDDKTKQSLIGCNMWHAMINSINQTCTFYKEAHQP